MKKIVSGFLFVNTMFLLVTAMRLYWFVIPCRLEVDCRGYGVDTEWLKQWERQEEKEGEGILAMAGWQEGVRTEIVAVSTRRKEQAKILRVYGSMEQVFSADLLSGSCGLVGREDVCVLSQDLAEALFGSMEVVGEQVQSDGELLEVAGVLAQEGEYLLVLMTEGEVERIAVLFERRFQAKERMQERFPFFDSDKQGKKNN